MNDKNRDREIDNKDAAGNNGAPNDNPEHKGRDCGCVLYNWWDIAVAWVSRMFHRGR
jgi:hypothetical protein